MELYFCNEVSRMSLSAGKLLIFVTFFPSCVTLLLSTVICVCLFWRRRAVVAQCTILFVIGQFARYSHMQTKIWFLVGSIASLNDVRSVRRLVNDVRELLEKAKDSNELSKFHKLCWVKRQKTIFPAVFYYQPQLTVVTFHVKHRCNFQVWSNPVVLNLD